MSKIFFKSQKVVLKDLTKEQYERISEFIIKPSIGDVIEEACSKFAKNKFIDYKFTNFHKLAQATGLVKTDYDISDLKETKIEFKRGFLSYFSGCYGTISLKPLDVNCIENKTFYNRTNYEIINESYLENLYCEYENNFNSIITEKKPDIQNVDLGSLLITILFENDDPYDISKAIFCVVVHCHQNMVGLAEFLNDFYSLFRTKYPSQFEQFLNQGCKVGWLMGMIITPLIYYHSDYYLNEDIRTFYERYVNYLLKENDL